jgi:hypothetical protein
VKKIAILVLVVALLVGLVCIGLPAQTSAYSPFPKPTPSMPKGPGLVTIVEGKTLGPGDVFASDWMDVTCFRLFKLYASLKTDGSDPGTSVVIVDNPLGDEDEGVYGAFLPYEWWPHPPDQSEWWGIAYQFEGLYSKIRIVAINESEVNTETISLYLLRALE